MADLKITIEQLKNYLGAGLEVQVGTTSRHITAICNDSHFVFVTAWKGSREKQMVGIENVKPICFRLSDLDKFIPELGFVPLDEIAIYSPSQKDYLIDEILRGFVEHMIFEMIVKWNFWPFGDEYFTEGLVIDKLKIT